MKLLVRSYVLYFLVQFYVNITIQMGSIGSLKYLYMYVDSKPTSCRKLDCLQLDYTSQLFPYDTKTNRVALPQAPHPHDS